MKYHPIRVYLFKKRSRLGYSQYRVARESGISHQHYNRIENGVINYRITFRTLVKIAKCLKISAQELITKEEEYQQQIISAENDSTGMLLLEVTLPKKSR